MDPWAPRLIRQSLRLAFLLPFLLSGCTVWEGLGAANAPATSPAPEGQPAPASPTLQPSTVAPDTGTPPPTPTTTPPASPSPTPAPLLRQITTGGCCTQPFWSPDSRRVLYLDKPTPDSQSGIWAVPIAGGTPELLTSRLGIYAPDLSLVAYPENGQTVIERLADGTRWIIPSEGRAVSFSPDGSQVAWTASRSAQAFDNNPREIWVGGVDGSQARRVFTMYGGGLAGWFPDGRLLVTGRADPAEEQIALWIVSPVDGATFELARASRLRGVLLAPGGEWLAYASVFDPDPAQNGLWLIRTATGERYPIEPFGAYRWRDPYRLLIVPLDLTQPDHRFMEIDTRQIGQGALQAVPLTDPAITPFKIANADWSVSPDGQRLVFLSARDHNLWVLELPVE